MTAWIRTSALPALLIGMSCCGASFAGLNEGLDALRKQDYATAAKELRPLAEQGNAEAQYRIGRMYEFGAGFPTDKAQGIAWFRRAAAQNHTAAQQELGFLYTNGDGVIKDDAQAVGWFEKAANLGNATAQYNLGLMIAKGAGVRRDDAQAIAWFRKSAAQGFAPAQFKLGLAYEYGEGGAAKDPVLAYANYAIAARDGTKEYVEHRDGIAAKLSPAQKQQGSALANAWTVGQAMPAGVVAAASAAPVKEKCSATGQMEGEKFIATYCAVSLMGDQGSVAIWFNEDPITAQEAASFQTSSYADGAKGGKPRTMLTIMFCPGVKKIDFNTSHAKSPLAGVQWRLEAPKDFKVEKMAGDIKPGELLSGRIVGSRGRTSFTLDFDVVLPAKDAAAGLGCGK